MVGGKATSRLRVGDRTVVLEAGTFGASVKLKLHHLKAYHDKYTGYLSVGSFQDSVVATTGINNDSLI